MGRLLPEKAIERFQIKRLGIPVAAPFEQLRTGGSGRASKGDFELEGVLGAGRPTPRGGVFGFVFMAHNRQDDPVIIALPQGL